MDGSGIGDDWELTSSSSEARTLVLVGRTGNGKSATGNSILGRRAFTSRARSSGVTSTCQLQHAVLRDGQIIYVVDTPGLFDFSEDSEFVGKEIVNCMKLANYGIHAVLVVFSVRTRFSREEEAAIRTLKMLFGEKIVNYMIVVFTGGDDLEENEETLQDYLGRECPDPLKEILRMCGNRCVLFDNKTKDAYKKGVQLQSLLALVNSVVSYNNGQPYSDELFAELKRLEKEEETGSIIRYSKGGEEHVGKSEEEQLKRIVDMVESKLKVTFDELREQLMEEKRARLKAEANARASHARSSEEIQSLLEKLERAKLETEKLRSHVDNIRCTIL